MTKDRPEPQPRPKTGPKSGGYGAHRKRSAFRVSPKSMQNILLAAVGLFIVFAIGIAVASQRVATEPGSFEQAAIAIEVEHPWADVLNIHLIEMDGMLYLDIMVTIPMYQVPAKTVALAQTIYGEALKLMGGSEDYISILWLVGSSYDIRYRATLTTFLESRYFGRSFDPQDWESMPQDFPLKSEHVKWPNR